MSSRKECFRCKVIGYTNANRILLIFSLQATPNVDESGFSFTQHDAVREKFRKKIAEAEEEEGVRRKDLKKLREHLDEQISALKVRPPIVLLRNVFPCYF